MRTRTTVAGRALHPMLILVPLGAFPLSLLFDALHVWDGARSWHRHAAVATFVGAAALLVAVTPAVLDLLLSVPREGAAWKHALTHAALGSAIVGYFTLMAIARWRVLDGYALASPLTLLAFNAVGNLALIAQGYLGGTLVKRHRIGVVPRDRA